MSSFSRVVLVCTLTAFAATVAVASAPDPPAATRREARIKDISSIEGIRDNQLVGYGIVVGLQGTGDSQQTTFPTQTLAATLLRMGVSVPAASIRIQNLAAVFVAATLPPFARPGTKLDITVSSAGDARSLEGGLLLMTPLYGADGKIYAQAQGPLVVGGYSVSVNGNTRQFNHPNTARVPLGAITERGGSARADRQKAVFVAVERCRLSQRRSYGKGDQSRTGSTGRTRSRQPADRSVGHKWRRYSCAPRSGGID